MANRSTTVYEYSEIPMPLLLVNYMLTPHCSSGVILTPSVELAQARTGSPEVSPPHVRPLQGKQQAGAFGDKVPHTQCHTLVLEEMACSEYNNKNLYFVVKCRCGLPETRYIM